MPTFEDIRLRAGSGPKGVIKTIGDVTKFYPDAENLAKNSKPAIPHIIETFRQSVGGILTTLQERADSVAVRNYYNPYISFSQLVANLTNDNSDVSMQLAAVEAAFTLMGFGSTRKKMANMLEGTDPTIVARASQEFLAQQGKGLELFWHEPQMLIATYADGYEAYAIFSQYERTRNHESVYCRDDTLKPGETKLRMIGMRRRKEY